MATLIFHSPFPDSDIPDVPFHRYVLRRAEELGDKPAFIDGVSGEATSYADLAATVEAAARGLAASGFRPGDTLALCSPNLPGYAVVFLAVSSLGGVVTTVNPLMTAREIAGQLVDSDARFVVTVASLLDKVGEAASSPIDGRSARVDTIFLFGGAGDDAFGSVIESGASLLAAGDAVSEPPIDPAADTVVLPYSSGTTGMPKGVMLTHRNLVSNMQQIIDADPMDTDEVLIGVLPFFHIYGMIVIMGCGLARGNTIVTLPRFDLEEFLEVMATHRVSRSYVVPPILLALAKHPVVDNYDLEALRVVFVGAAPVSPEISEACEARLDCKVRQGYGLTEASPVTHITPADDSYHRLGSAGPPVPNSEAKVIDLDTGEALEPGGEGEILV